MGALGLFIDGRKRIENLVEVDWKDYVEQAFLNVVIRRARCDHLIWSRRSQSKTQRTQRKPLPTKCCRTGIPYSKKNLRS